jgi:uncharacterized delta-60 repeat protein
VTDFTTSLDFTTGRDFATAMAIQADGKIVAAGTSNFQSLNSNFALVRYEIDGALDAGFGTGGVVTTDLSGDIDNLYAMAIQPDGKIVAVGDSTVAGLDYAVVRYLPDGSLDPLFGTGGIVGTDLGTAFDSARDVAIQADAKILVGGTHGLVRYNPDGSLDGTFGSGGIVSGDLGVMLLLTDEKILVARPYVVSRYNQDGSLDTTFPTFLSQVKALAVQPDDKILVVGADSQNVLVVRYDSSGSWDTGFGVGGIATIGRIVVAGSDSGELAVLRLEADGAVDTTFGSDPPPGVMELPFHVVGHATAYDVAIQADGRIVAAGGTSDGSDWQFVAVRLALATCGNGVQEPGETCEDGNLTDGDSCDSNCTPTGCGNDIQTAGEECDDGNTVSGDCCDAACQIPVCTRAAEKTQLLLKRGNHDDKDKLQFKWLKGDATSQSEFGDPTASTPYQVCLRADDELVLDARIAPSKTCYGKPCWKALSSKGYKFLDKSKRNDGITFMLLKGSTAAKSLVKVKGQGSNLSLFTALPLAEPVTLQVVQGDTGLCFEGSYSGAQISDNDDSNFKAKTP